MKQVLIIFICLFTFSFAIVEKAEACFCKPLPFPIYIRQATTIFEGTVITRQINNKSNIESVTFKVERVWKGERKSEVVIFQGTRFDCQYNFEIGKKYIVFADTASIDSEKADAKLWTDGCNGNNVFSEKYAKQIVKEINKANKIKKS